MILLQEELIRCRGDGAYGDDPLQRTLGFLELKGKIVINKGVI